ncbi:3-isopropylmalate dehydratase small subunit [Sulfitobacter sp. S190]|uniref:3-isopropylmalate dehydratase small subunit n=1 Tax=Sulfitobacter sp. S190 TaxID=2867022 RepID=UPI0021A4F984|nr:3-isopropylmalate dehydratase small subunit [Sulfitobacter sp. S190]UWR24294.1 3-isopropylmalate dehydratase small subunit [Sulfitobacter sp. S190]
MSGWRTLSGTAVALPQANIDTDQLIPARFMSQPRANGYGSFLLHDARQDDPDHPLNRHLDAKVLVTRRNFGTGSSREAAVYALSDFGIRAVLAPSFGDIFAANAVNNGVLPAKVDAQIIENTINRMGEGAHVVTLSLDACMATIGNADIPFTLDPMWQRKLMNGWDDIDLTQQHAPEIAEFRAARWAAHPWAMPRQKTPHSARQD